MNCLFAFLFLEQFVKTTHEYEFTKRFGFVLFTGSPAEDQRLGSFNSRTCRQELPLDDGSLEKLLASSGEAWC